jgi:hypothetical protein
MSFLEKKETIILISFIWGLGLAMLFKKTCSNRNCIVIRAPNLQIKNGTEYIEDNNKCYSLHRYSSKCM